MIRNWLIAVILALSLAGCSPQMTAEVKQPTATMTPRPTFTATALPTATVTHTATAASTPTQTATATANATATPVPQPTPTPRIHVVAAGETLSTIAEAYGVTTEALVEANDIDNPSLITIGQELIIPAD
ncbi:MAG: LysM peptidoglycan-binding domain-containing protein [Anaerolineae bacterium]